MGSLAPAVHADTKRVYVARAADSDVAVIDGATDTVIATVAVGDRPSSVAVNADTNRIYVATADDDAVAVIDGTTNTVAATISMAVTP